MSEALRLADEIDNDPMLIGYDQHAAELRRLHDLHGKANALCRIRAERIKELEAELMEQARVNGMGSEREARLMALNAELVEALRLADLMLSGANMDAKAVERSVKAALANSKVNLEG